MAATEDSDIPETGAVFTFGKSKFADNLPNKFWVKNDRVTQVACGDEHTALVVDSGRVFMFGLNDWGQLGLGQDIKPGINKPSCIKTLKHEKSKLVACGRSHTIISTEAGHIYSFGSNSEGQLGLADDPDQYTPRHIESLEATNYKMLTAGSDSSMALTEDGRLFVWGGNEDGKLGLGEDLQNASVPAHLEFDHPVVCVACGYYHTAVVTDDGKLYTMGESDGGKLGLSDDVENTKVPNHVTAIPDPVKWVACGSSHTVALTEFGECYVFGEGENGQLGLGTDLLSTSTPTLLQLPFKVVRVFCGQDFTALISERGQLYTFGDGRYGKLGHGSDQFSNLYKPNHCKRFSHFTVEKVACGGCHMIVTAKVKIRDRTIESEDEADELSDTISKSEESPSLTRSLSARERRRNELQKSYSNLSQTLPALTAFKGLSSLSATMPALKSSQPKVNGLSLNKTVVPKLNNILNGKASPINSSEESGDEGEKESEEQKPPNQPTNSTLPVASPRRKPPQLKEQNHVEDGSDGDDEDDSESENEAKHSKERTQNKSEEEKDEQNEVNNIIELPSKQEADLDSDLELKRADIQKENMHELQLVDENANEKDERLSDEVEELDEEETTPRESPTAQVPVATPRRKQSDVQHEKVKEAEDDSASDDKGLKDKDEEERKDHKDKEKEKKKKKEDKDNDDTKEKKEKEKKKKNKKDDEEEEVEDEEEVDDKKAKSKKDKKKKEKDKVKKKGRGDEDDEEEEKDKKKVKAKKKDKNKDKIDDKSNKKKNKKDDDSEENEEDEQKNKKAKNQTEDQNKDKNTEENDKDKKNKDKVKNGEEIVAEKVPVKANPPKRSRLCVIL